MRQCLPTTPSQGQPDEGSALYNWVLQVDAHPSTGKITGAMKELLPSSLEALDVASTVREERTRLFLNHAFA